MLKILISETEVYDEQNNTFSTLPSEELHLEHSLISISKWESIWHKPFISDEPKTRTEEISYIKCMTLNNISEDIYSRLTEDNIKEINEYINDVKSAIPIDDTGKTYNEDIITSELIYYWMAINNIPFDCDKWHLSRLLSLIRVFGIKNSPEEKRSESEIIADHKRLNKMRREAMNSTG